ncbi:MAG: insulinase family protein, partial [Bacteroidales bacterium]|nr:insulinase family protein [Bacteroidales bacterium]
SLKTSKNRETWKDNNIRIQKGAIYKEIEKPLKVSKTTNYIRYSADLPFNMNNRVIINAIDNLLTLRYTATIREEEGGSYGVGVNGFISNKPIETAALGISFDTDPKLYKRMLKIVHAEIKSLAEKGPKAEDLSKVKLNMIKQYKEDIAENGWWMQTIASYYRDGLNYCTDYGQAIENLNAKSISAVAKVFLEQKNLTEILLMPSKKK